MQFPGMFVSGQSQPSLWFLLGMRWIPCLMRGPSITVLFNYIPKRGEFLICFEAIYVQTSEVFSKTSFQF